MIFKTTLKAGQASNFAKTGRYFYLLTAPDTVRITFRNIANNGNIDLTSEMREGMAADFPYEITDLTLVNDTKTAQYIEFWLGNTKLDYSKLAAGGASAGIDSGRAVCELGRSLAIPADFRRKSINLQALNEVTVGGINVTAGNGYVMQTGEKLKLDTRGDIYTYLTPARINHVEANVTIKNNPLPTNVLFNHTGAFNDFITDRSTQNLIACHSKIIYSQDNGDNWKTSVYPSEFEAGSSELFIKLKRSPDGIFTLKNTGDILVSRDGGASFKLFAFITGALNASSRELINELVIAYGFYVSPDEQRIIISTQKYIWDSKDGGKSFKKIRVQNYDIVEMVPKDDKIYCASHGMLIVLDKHEIKKVVSLYTATDKKDYLAVIGENVIWYNSSKGGLYLTSDDGDTVTKLLQTPDAEGSMFVIGETVIVAGADSLNYFKTLEKEVTTVDANTDNIGSRVGRLTANNDYIFVNQYRDGENLQHALTVYPISLSDGAAMPAPLQWLAELN